jgi:hypothetical protein
VTEESSIRLKVSEAFTAKQRAKQQMRHKPTSELVGKYFIGPYPENTSSYSMGYIRSAEGYGFFLVDMYDWLIGAFNNHRLVHLSEMGAWRFYNERADLSHEAKRHMRREQQRDDERGEPAEEGADAKQTPR